MNNTMRNELKYLATGRRDNDGGLELPKDTTLEKIARKVAALRRRGLTCEEIGSKLGMNPHHVYNLMRTAAYKHAC